MRSIKIYSPSKLLFTINIWNFRGFNLNGLVNTFCWAEANAATAVYGSKNYIRCTPAHVNARPVDGNLSVETFLYPCVIFLTKYNAAGRKKISPKH